MSALELRHLAALVAVAEEGTFTDAAVRLGVTQSAVSRMIVGLEEAVGVPLVNRTTRVVALTDAGERCRAAAARALAAVDDVRAAALGTVRPLRLGYAWSALGGHTTAVLRAWRSQHPDVALEVHRRDEVDGGLARGRSDVAVVRGGVDLPGTVSRHVLDEAPLAVVPVGDPLAARPSLTLADLTDRTVLTSPHGTTSAALWPEPPRPGFLRVDNTDEWLTEIAGGLGVGVTAAGTAWQHAHPGLVYVPLTDAPPVAVRLVWPRQGAHPAIADFVALVTEVVAAAAPGPAPCGLCSESPP